MSLNKFFVSKVKDGYIFQANPINSKSQPLGISSAIYKDYKSCNQAMQKFILLVRDTNYSGAKIEQYDGLYYFRYYDTNGVCVFKRTKGYVRKDSCIKGIAAVYKSAVNTEI